MLCSPGNRADFSLATHQMRKCGSCHHAVSFFCFVSSTEFGFEPELGSDSPRGGDEEGGGHLPRRPPGDYICGATCGNFRPLPSQSIHSTEFIHLRMQI